MQPHEYNVQAHRLFCDVVHTISSQFYWSHFHDYSFQSHRAVLRFETVMFKDDSIVALALLH